MDIPKYINLATKFSLLAPLKLPLVTNPAKIKAINKV